MPQKLLGPVAAYEKSVQGGLGEVFGSRQERCAGLQQHVASDADVFDQFLN